MRSGAVAKTPLTIIRILMMIIISMVIISSIYIVSIDIIVMLQISVYAERKNPKFVSLPRRL